MQHTVNPSTNPHSPQVIEPQNVMSLSSMQHTAQQTIQPTVHTANPSAKTLDPQVTEHQNANSQSSTQQEGFSNDGKLFFYRDLVMDVETSVRRKRICISFDTRRYRFILKLNPKQVESRDPELLAIIKRMVNNNYDTLKNLLKEHVPVEQFENDLKQYHTDDIVYFNGLPYRLEVEYIKTPSLRYALDSRHSETVIERQPQSLVLMMVPSEHARYAGKFELLYKQGYYSHELLEQLPVLITDAAARSYNLKYGLTLESKNDELDEANLYANAASSQPDFVTAIPQQSFTSVLSASNDAATAIKDRQNSIDSVLHTDKASTGSTQTLESTQQKVGIKENKQRDLGAGADEYADDMPDYLNTLFNKFVSGDSPECSIFDPKKAAAPAIGKNKLTARIPVQEGLILPPRHMELLTSVYLRRVALEYAWTMDISQDEECFYDLANHYSKNIKVLSNLAACDLWIALKNGTLCSHRYFLDPDNEFLKHYITTTKFSIKNWLAVCWCFSLGFLTEHKYNRFTNHLTGWYRSFSQMSKDLLKQQLAYNIQKRSSYSYKQERPSVFQVSADHQSEQSLAKKASKREKVVKTEELSNRDTSISNRADCGNHHASNATNYSELQDCDTADYSESSDLSLTARTSEELFTGKELAQSQVLSPACSVSKAEKVSQADSLSQAKVTQAGSVSISQNQATSNIDLVDDICWKNLIPGLFHKDLHFEHMLNSDKGVAEDEIFRNFFPMLDGDGHCDLFFKFHKAIDPKYDEYAEDNRYLLFMIEADRIKQPGIFLTPESLQDRKWSVTGPLLKRLEMLKLLSISHSEYKEEKLKDVLFDKKLIPKQYRNHEILRSFSQNDLNLDFGSCKNNQMFYPQYGSDPFEPDLHPTSLFWWPQGEREIDDSLLKLELKNFRQANFGNWDDCFISEYIHADWSMLAQFLICQEQQCQQKSEDKVETYLKQQQQKLRQMQEQDLASGAGAKPLTQQASLATVPQSLLSTCSQESCSSLSQAHKTVGCHDTKNVFKSGTTHTISQANILSGPKLFKEVFRSKEGVIEENQPLNFNGYAPTLQDLEERKRKQEQSAAELKQREQELKQNLDAPLGSKFNLACSLGRHTPETRKLGVEAILLERAGLQYELCLRLDEGMLDTYGEQLLHKFGLNKDPVVMEYLNTDTTMRFKDFKQQRLKHSTLDSNHSTPDSSACHSTQESRVCESKQENRECHSSQESGVCDFKQNSSFSACSCPDASLSQTPEESMVEDWYMRHGNPQVQPNLCHFKERMLLPDMCWTLGANGHEIDPAEALVAMQDTHMPDIEYINRDNYMNLTGVPFVDALQNLDFSCLDEFSGLASDIVLSLNENPLFKNSVWSPKYWVNQLVRPGVIKLKIFYSRSKELDSDFERQYRFDTLMMMFRERLLRQILRCVKLFQPVAVLSGEKKLNGLTFCELGLDDLTLPKMLNSLDTLFCVATGGKIFERCLITQGMTAQGRCSRRYEESRNDYFYVLSVDQHVSAYPIISLVGLVAHELTHLGFFDHSPRFKATLNLICPFYNDIEEQAYRLSFMISKSPKTLHLDSKIDVALIARPEPIANGIDRPYRVTPEDMPKN